MDTYITYKKNTLMFILTKRMPDPELLLYDLDNEPDINYKNLVQEELEYIRKNKDKIIKRAQLIYNKKISGNPDKVFTYCLDYEALESMCMKWKEIVS